MSPRGSGSDPRRTERGGRTIEGGQDLDDVRTASAGLSRRSVTITSHQPDQDPSIVAPEAPRHSTVESEAPILCLVSRGPPGQRGASLTPQSGAGRRRLPLELRAARLVAVVGGVVIALSGACGSEAHAGGNLPEFTDGRYRRRNLPFNSTPANDEVVCAGRVKTARD